MKKIYIWHDDIRRPPWNGWVWCRTNDQVKNIMENVSGAVVEAISLDHDMGLDSIKVDDAVNKEYINSDEYWECIHKAGTSEDDGLKLVKWMCETGNVPEKVTIHSWNPYGAENMRKVFKENGYECVVAPFVVPT